MDYPAFQKKIAESDEAETYRRVYYAKHYAGYSTISFKGIS